MARVVLGIGVPPYPTFPKEVLKEGPGSESGALFRDAATRVAAGTPDHFVNFFFDNFPAIWIGIVDEESGPNETRVEMPTYTVRIHEAFAAPLDQVAQQPGGRLPVARGVGRHFGDEYRRMLRETASIVGHQLREGIDRSRPQGVPVPRRRGRRQDHDWQAADLRDVPRHRR